MRANKGVLSNTNMQVSLEHQLSVLAIESDVLANVISTFRNLVPNLVGVLKEKLSTVDEKEEIPELMVNISSEYKKLIKKGNIVPFLSINQTLISVPENFNGSFIEYAEFLNKHANELFVNANEILGDYQTLLSVFLSNQNTAIGVKDNTAFYKKIQKAREELVEQFSKYFPKDTGVSKQRLGSVIERYSDFDKLVKELVTLERTQEKQNMRGFKKAVDANVELLELVVRRTEETSIDKISGEVAKNIAEGAFEIGKTVELVALFRFRVQQFISAVDNTISYLNNEVLK